MRRKFSKEVVKLEWSSRFKLCNDIIKNVWSHENDRDNLIDNMKIRVKVLG